jgi:hypothetical protein
VSLPATRRAQVLAASLGSDKIGDAAASDDNVKMTTYNRDNREDILFGWM